MEFGVVSPLFLKHTGLSPDRIFCVFVWGLMTKPTRWRLFFLGGGGDSSCDMNSVHPSSLTAPFKSTCKHLRGWWHDAVNESAVSSGFFLFVFFYVLQCFVFWDRRDWMVSLYAKWLNFHSSLSPPLGLRLKKNAPPFLSLEFSSFSFKPSSGVTFQLSF